MKISSKRIFSLIPLDRTNQVSCVVVRGRSLYSKAALENGAGEEDSPISNLKSHIFQVSARAYAGVRALINGVETKKDQTIIMNGESGAGKTESFKLLLNHIAHIIARENGNLVNLCRFLPRITLLAYHFIDMQLIHSCN